LRCSSSGRQCDQSHHSAVGGLVRSSRSIVSYAIPFQVPGSQTDRRLLHFYCVKGAADLTGYLTSEFWTRVVLQRSQDQVAVRQAVVALSSLREQLFATGDDVSEVTPQEPLVLYNRAMRSLRKHLNAGIDASEPRSPMAPLICCILFHCFESMRGNTTAALQHLASGISILTSRGRQAGSAEETDIAALAQVLYRLDLQATFFDDIRVPLFPSGIAQVGKWDASFSSLDEALVALTKLQNWTLRFLITNERFKPQLSEDDLPADVTQEKRSLGAAFAGWKAAFESLLRTTSASLSGQDQEPPAAASPMPDALSFGGETGRKIAVIRIQFIIFTLLLASSTPDDPRVFCTPRLPQHQSAIDTMLDLAEWVVSDTEPGSVVVSAETGIVAPVFLLAMKSDDAAVVSRALNLLASYNRREGPYDSKRVVSIAQAIAAQGPELVQAPLEHRAGLCIDERIGGLDGIAKNYGLE